MDQWWNPINNFRGIFGLLVLREEKNGGRSNGEESK